MHVRAEFTGGDHIRTALATLDEAVSREISTAALLAAAEPIRDTAARLCPRSAGAGPHLADAIALAPVDPGAVAAGPETVTVAIGVPEEFFYDLFLELGTKRITRRSFYRPALDSEQAAAFAILREQYWRAIAAHAEGGP